MARFDGLTTGSDFSYRVIARSGPAEYSSDQMQLKGDAGMMALLHVYPVTRNPAEAAVGAHWLRLLRDARRRLPVRGAVSLRQPQPLSWVPEDARMSLPAASRPSKPARS